MKKFLKSLLLASFVFGCTEEGTPPIYDDTELGPFGTVSVEPLGTEPFDTISVDPLGTEPLNTVSVELTTDQETASFDPYNTVSFVEPLGTVSLWPLGTDEQESDTGSETEEESDTNSETEEEGVNCHNHYHCHWYTCHGHYYCHRHYHCQGHH